MLLFTTKFSPILIGLNRSRDAIVFIGGETLSAHSARPRKMPGGIVPVRENVSVNKRVCRKQTVEIVLRGFCLFSFSNFTFGFHGFCLKILKIIQLP